MVRTGRPKSDNPKNKRLPVRLEESIYNDFKKLCNIENIDMSSKIRLMIIEYLGNKKK